MGKIYIYSTNTFKYKRTIHEESGDINYKPWFKIGMTIKETEVRITQQDGTSNPEKLELLYELDLEPYKKNTYLVEQHIHKVLEDRGKRVRLDKDREWFELDSIDEAKDIIEKFLNNNEIHKEDLVPLPHQKEALKFLSKKLQEDNKVLLFHKARSGKTFITLKYISEKQIKNTVVITSYPILNTQWSDTIQILKGFGNYIIHDVSGYNIKKIKLDKNKNNIVLLSVQDIKGGENGVFEKEKFDLIKDIEWDLLIVDEVHYGIETEKTQKFFDKIKYNKMIGLSATPSKNLICGRFSNEQIHSYTLVDERKFKNQYLEEYKEYPEIQFLAWNIIKEERSNLKCFSDEEQFTMKKLFRIEKGNFYYKNDIIYLFKRMIGDRTVCRKDKLGTDYPFKNNGKFNSVNCVLLFVPSIEVQEKLQELLYSINSFKEEFTIHITNSNINSSKNLMKKIKREFSPGDKRSIILSVNQLTTGITLKYCDLVMLMNDWSSVDTWIQSSFRGQSPSEGKDQCFVIDMNPGRLFSMIYEYNSISSLNNKKSTEKNISEWFECVNVFNRVEGGLEKITHERFNEEHVKILLEKPRFDYNSVIFRDKIKSVRDRLKNLNISGSIKNEKVKTNPDGVDKGKNEKDGKKDSNNSNDKKNPEISEKKLMEIAKALVDKTMLVSLFTYNEHDNIDECFRILEEDITPVKYVDEIEKNLYLNSLLIDLKNVENVKLSDIIFIYNTIFDKNIINQKLYDFNRKIKGIKDQIQNGNISMLKNYLEIVNEYLKPSKTEKKNLAEVFTPIDGKGGVREQLSLLDEDFWKDPNKKVLDCSTGIGNYPIVLIENFMEGLKEWEPDESKRLKWILEEILYMVELQPKNVFILLNILDPDDKYKLNIHRGDFLLFDPVKEFGISEFDLICSNPPYQSNDGGGGGKGSSAKPLYNIFVERSLEISKKVIMITPSRWFIGGKGLDKFRKMMLGRNDLKFVEHIKGNGNEVFGKNVEIKGGVSFFLIDKEYNGNTILNGSEIDKTKLDILLDNPMHYQIIEKIKRKHKGSYFNSIVESRNYYGKIVNKSKTLQNGKECENEKIDDNYLKCYVSKAEGFEKWVHKDNIKEGIDYSNYKIFTTKGTNVGNMGNTFIAEPYEICTETYLVINQSSIEECLFNLDYFKCDFFRYLYRIINNTQNSSKETYKLIPYLFKKIESVDQIYNHFEMNSTEIDFINFYLNS